MCGGGPARVMQSWAPGCVRLRRHTRRAGGRVEIYDQLREIANNGGSAHEPARRRRRRGGVIGTGRHYRYPGRSAPSHRAAHVLCSPTIDFGGTLDAERDRSCDLSKYPLRLSPRRYIENRIYRSGDRARTIQYVVLLVSLFHLLFYADFSLDCSRDLAASYALS